MTVQLQVDFKNVKTNIHEHKVHMELAWDRPISFGAPVMQYYVLRRRIRKTSIGNAEKLNEFPWYVADHLPMTGLM